MDFTQPGRGMPTLSRGLHSDEFLIPQGILVVFQLRNASVVSIHNNDLAQTEDLRQLFDFFAPECFTQPAADRHGC